MTKNPYLTIINGKTKYNPDDFKDFEYDEVEVRFGDWGKKTAIIEKQTHEAYKKAVKDFEKIGATCTLNSAGRSKFDQVYTKIEKFGGTLKNSKSIIKAVKETHDSVAKIGYSEHLSALAIDMSVDMKKVKIPEEIKAKYNDKNRDELEEITRRIIMAKHGFIMSYPGDIRMHDVTGISKKEKWHWRYIGPEHSQRIFKIHEKVVQDLHLDYEVFLEDYVELLDYDITGYTEEDIVSQYVYMFESDILEVTPVAEEIEVTL